jgi:hypothetical protein
MKKTLNAFLIGVLMLVLSAAAVSAVSEIFPSTNDANRDEGWAHVNKVAEDISNGVGSVTLEFVSTRSFYSCFEYRTDGDESQAIDDEHFNPELDDVLYPYTCVNNSTTQIEISASEYVEVRLAFGAEKDERFDWTRFEVPPGPQTKEECMNGGWESFGFPNQGQCIQFVNTSK